MGTKTDYRHFDIGARIRELCEERGISHEELTEQAGISSEEMQKLLHNDKDISIEAMARVCIVFDMQFAEFYQERHSYAQIRKEIVSYMSTLDDKEITTIRDFLKIVEKYSK